MAPKKMPLPNYLPDPDTCSDVVNMAVIVERMLVEIKTALGQTFAVKPAAVIGDKGWSAPFNVDQAFTGEARISNSEIAAKILEAWRSSDQ